MTGISKLFRVVHVTATLTDGGRQARSGLIGQRPYRGRAARLETVRRLFTRVMT